MKQNEDTSHADAAELTTREGNMPYKTLEVYDIDEWYYLQRALKVSIADSLREIYLFGEYVSLDIQEKNTIICERLLERVK